LPVVVFSLGHMVTDVGEAAYVCLVTVRWSQQERTIGWPISCQEHAQIPSEGSTWVEECSRAEENSQCLGRRTVWIIQH